jgi:hypothetical protein
MNDTTSPGAATWSDLTFSRKDDLAELPHHYHRPPSSDPLLTIAWNHAQALAQRIQNNYPPSCQGYILDGHIALVVPQGADVTVPLDPDGRPVRLVPQEDWDRWCRTPGLTLPWTTDTRPSTRRQPLRRVTHGHIDTQLIKIIRIRTRTEDGTPITRISANLIEGPDDAALTRCEFCPEEFHWADRPRVRVGNYFLWDRTYVDNNSTLLTQQLTPLTGPDDPLITQLPAPEAQGSTPEALSRVSTPETPFGVLVSTSILLRVSDKVPEGILIRIDPDKYRALPLVDRYRVALDIGFRLHDELDKAFSK